MNRLQLAIFALLVSSALPVSGQSPVSSRDRARIDSLVARMTLEEKVGQMTQITLGAVAAPGSPQRDSVRLDPAKLREAVVERHVGSMLNVLGGALTPRGWHAMLKEIQDLAVKETRLGIPLAYGVDAVHGVNYTRGATLFPHNLGIAATFDTAVARRAGQVTGAELLASGVPWNFAPVLDVGRQPLWPRFYETFGEDPLLASRMGAEMVRAMQRSGRVAATAKHFLGYGAPRSGRDRTGAQLTLREVREHHLPPFRAAVTAGALSIMVNSGDLDGVPVHASRYWLTDVLRHELGFEGVVVSDWEDVHFLHTRHRVAPTLRDAVRMAVDAGLDVSMTPNDFRFADLLLELVRDGEIAESRIDQSVRRVLTMKARLGLFDAPYPAAPPAGAPATAESRSAARDAARQSVTLLKNSGVLPLRRDARVLVTGPAARSLTALHGGWTATWQGTDASQLPEGAESLLDAIRARAATTTFEEGAGFTGEGDVASAARAAAAADVAVVALGEDAYAEWVGDIGDLSLPPAQLRLAAAVQATGTPTVLVLVQGRPRLIESVADGAEGIVMAYWPGTEGAAAVAEVLFGEVNPSGRLPFTYPRHPNALIPYDHAFAETLNTDFGRAPGGFDPQFEFGHGLGYTTFRYRDLRVGRDTVGPGEEVSVQVTVTNAGTRAGREAVLLFVRQHFAAISPPVRRLRAFEKISLEPGESRTVRFVLSGEDLRYTAQDGRRVLEGGRFSVMAGPLVTDFHLVGPPAIGRPVP